MALRSVPQPQLGFDERVIEDTALEGALEQRLTRKEAAGEARKHYKAAHEKVAAMVDQLGLTEDDAIRVGRFRITRRAIAGRSVSFDTDPTTRLTITVLRED